MCSCIHYIITLTTLALIGVAAYFIAKYAINKAGLNNQVQDINNGIRDKLNQLFKQGDPYTGQNNTQSWPNNGKGLDLTVINALTADWYPYFKTAIDEWDNGTPDALTLTTQIGQADSNCSAIEGVLKVCNGNYGETDWKGINKVLMDTVTNYIVASTALMNEYYLPSSASDDEKQYTMCHEIGHGFGLPHTDENFYNKDLGNCLDYTMNPGYNKQPAAMNYNLLAKVYGTVNGQQAGNSASNSQGGNSNTDDSIQTGQTSSSGSTNSNGSSSQQLKVEPNSGNNRRRLGQPDLGEGPISFDGTQHLEVPSVPAWVIEATNEIDTLFLNKRTTNQDYDSASTLGTVYRSRRLVEKTKFGEIHHIDLGDSYTVRVRILLA